MPKLFKILRLPEQTIAVVPFLFGALDSGFRDYPTLLVVGLATVCLNLSFYVINGFIDAKDTDKNNGRNNFGFDFSGHRKLIFLLWLIFTLTGSLIFLRFGLYLPLFLLLFFGNFYSAPPIRFKARFPWDMIAPMIAAGLIPYSLTYSLVGLPYESIINVGSVSFALFAIPMQGIHYLADAEDDKKAGIVNFCTVMGYRPFLRLIDKIAIGGLLGFIYLIYRHERFWYWPVILASIYELLIIGYARAAIHHPTLQRLQSIANRSYQKGILVFALILIFQIWVLARWPAIPP